jgi:hypothetical protein
MFRLPHLQALHVAEEVEVVSSPARASACSSLSLAIEIFYRCLLVATYVVSSQPKFVWVAPVESLFHHLALPH